MSPVNKKKPEKDMEYWRSPDQLAGSEEYNEFLRAEFPRHPEEEKRNDPISRRTFLSLMGASLALSGMVGCRRPVEKIVPYVDAPEQLILGEPEYYATTMPFGTSAYGLVVTCHEGRPTKIEGNEGHPASRGKTNAFLQAAILNLYDPDRSRFIRHNGSKSDWDSFIEAWNPVREESLANGGEGIAVISEEFASPTLSRLKKRFLKQYPKAGWAAYSPVSDENIFAGIRIASGKNLRPVYHFAKAGVIVALDSDFLMMESENVTAALGFAEGRRINGPQDKMNRLYVIEPGFTITGAMADHRLRLPAGQVGDFTVALARELRERGLTIPALDAFSGPANQDFDRRYLRELANDLLMHRGDSLLLAGRRQGKAIQALVLSINFALGNLGNTVSLHPLEDTVASDREAFGKIVSEMHKGKVSTLVLLGGNPVYNAPADLRFGDALARVERSIHLGDYFDETAKLCNWHIHRAHFLEAWGDTRAADGTAGVIQPMIMPLYYGISDVEMLHSLIEGEIRPGHDIVKETWETAGSFNVSGFDWRRVLHDGFIEGSESRPVQVRINETALAKYAGEHYLPSSPSSQTGIEVVFAADHSVYDGRFANNGWLQELPDPLTKLIWDNAALMSAETAEKLGIGNGDIIRIKHAGASVEMPAWILPGHTNNVITLPLGYGREGIGRVADGVGHSVQAIRTTGGMEFFTGAKIVPTGEKYPLSSTQNHGSMEGRPLIREATVHEYAMDPKFAQHKVHIPDLQSLWKEHQYDKGNQWGMSIDLNACIGCGACTIACQSENNIPIVGKEQGGYGREMHWIRVDRYFGGDEDNPRVGFQPVACQHCEMAPCEQVCPVAATVHDKEGLNVMTYNRCIGTRYCSNNCPYKVRRFNFFNYTNTLPELVKMVQNPDVTVRSRGVMEKCTYCLQRINRAKRRAKLDGGELHDGELKTACQQACPTDAIRFGNILDTESEIVKAKLSERTYEILAEFNLRPRTSYQARLRNPNPKLEV